MADGMRGPGPAPGSGPGSNPSENPKIKQNKANYRATANLSRKCMNCRNFVPQDTCRRVQGQVSPAGVCDYWAPVTAGNPVSMAQEESLKAQLFGAPSAGPGPEPSPRPMPSPPIRGGM